MTTHVEGPASLPFDLGHRGDVDYTQLVQMLAMTPAERLRHHEPWRALVKMGPVVPQFVEGIVARLAEGQVEFLIVGGVCGILHGSSLATVDLDICYRRTPANIARLVRALAPLNPRPRGWPPGLPFAFDERTVQLGSNFTLKVGVEDLDLLGEMSGIGGYEQVIGDAVDAVVGGCSVKVLSLPRLIATKVAAGRTKDLGAIPVLQALLDLQRQKGQQPDDKPAAS